MDSFGRRLAGFNDGALRSQDVKAQMDLHRGLFADSAEAFPWLLLDNRDSRALLVFSRQHKFIIFAKF